MFTKVTIAAIIIEMSVNVNNISLTHFIHIHFTLMYTVTTFEHVIIRF